MKCGRGLAGTIVNYAATSLHPSLAAGQVLSSQPNRSRQHKTIRLTAGANPRPPEYGAAALTTTPTRRLEAAGRCRIDARPSAAAGGHCRLESAESRVSRVFHLVTGGFLGTTTYHQMRLDELYTPRLKIQSNFQKKRGVLALKVPAI